MMSGIFKNEVIGHDKAPGLQISIGEYKVDRYKDSYPGEVVDVRTRVIIGIRGDNGEYNTIELFADDYAELVNESARIIKKINQSKPKKLNETQE